MNLQGNQDWAPVVLTKKKGGGGAKSGGQAGDASGPSQKFNSGRNTAHGGTTSGKDARKIEAEEEDFTHSRVSDSLKKQIQQARMAKKMTQAQLGQAINEKPAIIQSYENGSAIPNPQVISKLSRILGVKLSNKK